LKGENETAQQLRNNFIFKIIPCLNPDGVICGNYRSSLAGVDLNRQWQAPDPKFHPIIDATKKMLHQIRKIRYKFCYLINDLLKREILVFCDLHCHSKKKNSFLYGCNYAPNEGFSSWTKVFLKHYILKLGQIIPENLRTLFQSL
jgi:cytosolic carboxypeptidase protein 2/3